MLERSHVLGAAERGGDGGDERMVVVPRDEDDLPVSHRVAKLGEQRPGDGDHVLERALAQLEDVAEEDEPVGAADRLYEAAAGRRAAGDVVSGAHPEVEVGDDDGAHAGILTAAGGTLALPGSSLARLVVSLFCRHNRFTVDCPICSKGTILERPAREPRARRPRSAAKSRDRMAGREAATRPPGGGVEAPEASRFRGRYGAVGPYERDGGRYEVRLERVPGGLRLGDWSGEALAARAPVLARSDLSLLVDLASHAGALDARDEKALRAALDEPVGELAREPAAEPGARAPSGSGVAASGESADGTAYGASPGRSGELHDELRVELFDGDSLRVARWVLRPGRGWERLDAPTILPVRRYAEALRSARARGVLA